MESGWVEKQTNLIPREHLPDMQLRKKKKKGSSSLLLQMSRTRILINSETSGRDYLGWRRRWTCKQASSRCIVSRLKRKQPYFRSYPGEVETMSWSPVHPCLSPLTDPTPPPLLNSSSPSHLINEGSPCWEPQMDSERARPP